MRHGSLFSGIGGFDLAAEWMGWENVFHCEWNEFGQKILNHYWPKAISYNDITKTDFTIHRGNIDIITGGFPCQPFSQAGKRQGTEDSRHLWPEMLRVIREIRPAYVVGENVTGLLNWSGGLVFEQVCLDLENEGYEVQPIIIPAASVNNAPHRRDRIWFVAQNTNPNGWVCKEWEKESNFGGFGNIGTGDNEQLQANNGQIGTSPNSNNTRANKRGRPNKYGSEKDKEREGQPFAESGAVGDVTADSNGRRQSSKEHREKESRRFAKKSIPNNWENFPTQSPVCGRDDGIPSRLDGITFSKWRNESIKGYGNAIVPQVAYEIFKAIQWMK